jgi:tRNA A37 threonylcarbamoyladenosine dehydratase
MLWWIVHKQMNMIVFAVHLDKLSREVKTDLRKDGTKSLDGISVQYSISILCNEDQMDMKLENTVPTVSDFTWQSHRPIAY